MYVPKLWRQCYDRMHIPRLIFWIGVHYVWVRCWSTRRSSGNAAISRCHWRITPLIRDEYRALTAWQNPPGTYIIPMIASSYTLACWVSSSAYMFIGQPLGRRRTILLGDGLVIVGGSLQASSWSVAQIIIARILCGFGVGLISCAVITYMSGMLEISCTNSCLSGRS